MALAIRLTRGGAKKRPYYRIVVADSRSPRDGRYIEKIGTYDPLQPKDSAEGVKFVEDRLKHWLGIGAQPTDRVLRFLDAAGMRTRDARSNPSKGSADAAVMPPSPRSRSSTPASGRSAMTSGRPPPRMRTGPSATW